MIKHRTWRPHGPPWLCPPLSPGLPRATKKCEITERMTIATEYLEGDKVKWVDVDFISTFLIRWSSFETARCDFVLRLRGWKDRLPSPPQSERGSKTAPHSSVLSEYFRLHRTHWTVTSCNDSLVKTKLCRVHFCRIFEAQFKNIFRRPVSFMFALNSLLSLHF